MYVGMYTCVYACMYDVRMYMCTIYSMYIITYIYNYRQNRKNLEALVQSSSETCTTRSEL